MSGSATSRCGLMVGPWANSTDAQSKGANLRWLHHAGSYRHPATYLRARARMPAFAGYDGELGPALPPAAGLLICPDGQISEAG